MLTVLFCSALALAAGIAAAITFNTPRPPPRMASMENVFDRVDFSDMPEKHVFTARDGERLAFRAYPGDPLNITVLVHGSSGTSAGMHAVARTIHAKGQTVYALAMRGHDGTGRSGDIDYVGQLEDDLFDFVRTMGPRATGESRTLLGFSSGGGFVLRFAGCRDANLFDRFILVSPQLPHNAPTSRPNAGGWVSIALPRFICLLALSQFGINAFGGLRVLALAVPPERRDVQTPFYSFRMQRNFGPSGDFLRDLKRAPGPVSLLVGSNDEIFRAEAYAPLLTPVRSDLRVTVVAGLGHMDMTVKPLALDALAAQF
jgi:alpha-beta hydrolase superfamily lysophospholipase